MFFSALYLLIAASSLLSVGRTEYIIPKLHLILATTSAFSPEVILNI